MIYKQHPLYREAYKQLRLPIKAIKDLGLSITELAPKLKEIREISLGSINDFNLEDIFQEENKFMRGFEYVIKSTKMWFRLIKSPPEKEVANIVYAFIFFCYLNGKEDF
jgi:hypothetical protein